MRTEKDIERELIDWLVNDLDYEFIKIKNSGDMESNIIDKLSIINKNVLNGRKLLPTELKEIIKEINRDSNDRGNYAYNFNKRLQSAIRIRDMLSEDSNRMMTIKLVSNTPSDNCFQVANQIRDTESDSETNNRYDVTLLLNGFPVVQIELKNVNIELNKAIDQIQRYTGHGYSKYFRYLQIFVVSNDMSTRYFVNNNTKVNKSFTFQWALPNNKKLDSLNEFAHSFFEKQNLHDMITKFIIRYGDENGQSLDKPMIIMRPYQVYAVRAVLEKLKKTIISNGYIYHTTGSGKTMTSWKCAQLAAELPFLKKVIFLVDRKDLSMQTIREFQSVDYKIDIKDDKNTKVLLENFRTSPLIVTTIQKFHRALTFAEDGQLNHLEYNSVFGLFRDKRLLFIIDECHRTQFGEMHTQLKGYFKQSQYIGFTGTPIFKENAGAGGKVTSELFGEMLHRYSIEDAIRDKSVLGFAIDYHNTLKGNEQLEKLSDRDQTIKIGINADEIKYNKERIKNIVDRIYTIHERKTNGKNYSALFAVDSIKALLKYYEAFKKKSEEVEESKRLKVSAIFTTTECSDDETGETYSELFRKIMDDFNKEYKCKCFDIDSFRAELVRKLIKREDLDIVIVVGIFLTGFDNKYTNTLYVDKNLEYHGLLQAFSRTNRIESNTKPFGNIVCFRPLKDNVDKAITLFSSGTDSILTVSRDYKVCFEHLDKIIDDVMSKVKDDIHISSSERSDTEKRDFILSMRDLNKALAEAKQFVEFDWKQIEDKLSKDTYNKLVGEYKNIYDYLKENEEKESILDYVDFCMELIESDKINVEYIKNLINNIDTSSKEGVVRSIERINTIIDKTNSDSIRNKKDIIKKFLEELEVTYESGIVKNASDIEREFRGYVYREKHRELKELADESNIDVNKIKEQMDSYEIVDKIDSRDIRELVRKNNKQMRMTDRTRLVRKIVKGIRGTVDKFKELF